MSNATAAGVFVAVSLVVIVAPVLVVRAHRLGPADEGWDLSSFDRSGVSGGRGLSQV
jgi:hypothetical protein